jgi:hypothetical protein
MIGQLPGKPTCPHCGGVADGYGGPHPPLAGDGAVCAHCGGRSVYRRNALTGRYTLELPTPEQLEQTATAAEVLPCGCIIDTVGDSFVMQPCRPDCTYFRYALAQAARQGMPVRTIHDPVT